VRARERRRPDLRGARECCAAGVWIHMDQPYGSVWTQDTILAVTAVNPFVWDRPIDDPSKIVGMDGFAREVALMLKGSTNVALFGPRDTGKTTFTSQLTLELARSHGPDAPPYAVIRINLQRAFSMAAFNACVHDALASHPERHIRREARRQLSSLEKEIGFDIKVIKGAVRRTGVTTGQDSEALHAQLRALSKLADHVIVVFDEFQVLRRCPDSPLAIIRSALMSSGTNHVSLLLTGSIREALRMMLENSEEPIFHEAAEMQLPRISRSEFFEFLEFNFEATGRQITEDALEHLLNVTGCHPMRTQQLAWAAWQYARAGSPIDVTEVDELQRGLLDGRDGASFETTLAFLLNGDEADANEARALFLLADRGPQRLTGRQNVALYGFTNASMIIPALERARRRGLTEQRAGEWTLVDPLFAIWLREQSPLALRVGDLDG
jgi:hypothetical protein